MDSRGKVALITGATGGLGKEFTKIHAQKGGDLVLVGRNQSKLDSLKEEIEKEYKVKVTTIAIDQSQLDSSEKIYEEVKKKGISVEYLINNAGLGGQGNFHERTMEIDMNIININMIALTKLTKLFLPDFVKRGHGKILNVSSTAGNVPGPLQAVYYATKAYVTSLSNALWREVEGTGVTVTALLPGAMNTGFAKASGLENTKMFQNTGSPVDVAKDGYEAMMEGKLEVISGLSFFQKPLFGLMSMLPKTTVMNMIYDQQKNISPEPKK